MLSLNTKNSAFAHTGLALLLVQLSLYVFGFSSFHYGIWYQVEPIMLAVYSLAVLNALWLGAGFFKGWLTVIKPVHPLLLCLLAWVGWQWLATACAFLPWRSWFGPPSIGEGAGYYTAMVMCSLLASALWRNGLYQRIILGVAALNLLMLAGLHADFSKLYQSKKDFSANAVAAANWPDYLAFIAAYFWLAFAASRHVRGKRIFFYVFALCIVIIALIAYNRVAIFFLLPALLATALMVLFAHRLPALFSGKMARALAAAACLAPVLWIAASQSNRWIEAANNSLMSRALLNQVGMSTMEHEPVRWLIGDGFGRFTDDLYKYALVDSVYAFRDGEQMRNWPLVKGSAMHSHNMAMEQLLSLGVVGLLLWLALPVIALWTLPRAKFWWAAPVLVGVTAVQGFWFYIPHVMAYQALSWAALASLWSRQLQSTQPAISRRWVAGPCALIAAVMCWTTHAQWQAMEYGQRLSLAAKQDLANRTSMEWLLDDMHRGGDRLRAVAWAYSGWVEDHISEKTLTSRDMQWYLQFLLGAHEAAQSPKAGAWLIALDLWLHNLTFMLVDNGELAKIRPIAAQSMEPAIMLASRSAPLREDMSASFLYSLDEYTNGDNTRALAILDKILAIAPEHRAALWVKGQHLLNTAQKAQGLQDMHRAILLGAQRVYPITPEQQRAAESIKD